MGIDSDKMSNKILALIFFIGCLFIFSTTFYELGLAHGSLLKMEEFKDVYTPNPKNVFPDAVGE